ncbi:hypothetical protein M8C21_013443, partial [Ambrosia artemisiifolia]
IFKWHAPPRNKVVVIGHDCLIEQDSRVFPLSSSSLPLHPQFGPTLGSNIFHKKGKHQENDTIVFMIASRMELGIQKECIWNILVGIGNVFHGKRSRSNVPCCTQAHMDAHLLLVL